jgi:Sigma-54 interaction domain
MKGPIPTDCWQVLQAAHPNVLVVNRDTQLRVRAVEAILDAARAPVWRCERRPLALPSEDVGTLLVPDVHALGESEQLELLAWARRHKTAQIVTATPVHLYPAVSAGRFLDELYYRINVLVIGEDA